MIGLSLIFYGVYGEDGFYALGLSAPLYAGVATRLAIFTRLFKRVANTSADLKLLHLAVLGGSFYLFDLKTIAKAHWPEVYGVGLISTYIAMGCFLYRYDLRNLKSRLSDSATSTDPTTKE